MTRTPESPSPEPTLKQVAAAHRAGRMGEARAACEQILAQSPDDGDARMWLGLIAMAERRWADAITAFDRALQIRVDPFTLVNLGTCYAKMGRLKDAEYCLRGATQVKSDLVQAHVGLATVLHGLRRFGDALSQLDIAADLDADYEVDLRRGCTLVELGRYDEARQAYARSAAGAGSPVYPRLVAFDRSTFESIAGVGPAVPPPDVAVADVAPDDARGVVLVSFDSSYARKYGFPFLRSYAEHANLSHLVHVHLFDPDAGIVEEIRNVARKAALGRLTVTTQACPYGPEAPQQRKAYYACGRFLQLPYWLERYRRPILSLDADIIVQAPLDTLFEGAPGTDVRLNPRHPSESPWLDVVANVIVAYPTPAARAYFAAVGNYTLAYLERETDPWFIDQAALFCVLKMMQRFGEPPAVDWIPQEQQAALWHLGHAYDYLLEDPRFKRYAGPPEGPQ